jgi:TrmH family RNA methyltransferase
LFVVEGIRAVEELSRSGLQIVGALASPELVANERAVPLRQALTARSVEIAEVTSAEFRSAAETESPQGILAIAHTPDRSFDQFADAEPARILVLDAVQDPGNVGTLLRTAAGLGVTATVALPGTVDLWNAKVVRSAMGAHFVHPAFHSTWDGLRQFLDQSGIPLWGADMHGVPASRSAAPKRLAIAVGNDGSGLSAEMRAAAHQLVALPLATGVESLNVAVAAGILLYELRP